MFYELNSDKLMIPASVLKLVTSAAALEILGPDYRFQTRLGYQGNIENGILKGDLIVIGGGDPALGSEYFPNHYFAPHFLEAWAASVKSAGINKVEGRLITDISLYNSEQIPPTWTWEDMGNYYGAGPNALTVYDNLSRVSFQSPPAAGMPTTLLSVRPPLKDIHWTNEVLSSDILRDLAYVFGSPIDNKRVIRGTIPKNRRIFTIKASNPHPEKLLADEFLNFLSSAGIFITGSITSEKVSPADFRQIAVLESPALAEIVKVLNQESVNLYAEHMVNQIAAELTGLGSRVAGLKIINDFWKDKGLDVGQLFMEDGSGLSHFNAASPRFVSSLLCYMKNSSTGFIPFYESLPAAGEGTLSMFNPGLFTKSSFRLKSGSMKRIRCYAGYINSESGNDYTVVVIINHFSGSHTKLMMELEKLFTEIKNL
ncbi:MAG: D-alanyl-D-alanine carboxypeptidase/D-alanyl-D-alanine-endopeptidase [Bacteroidota bacterium]